MFADDGAEPPFTARKTRACEAAGVEAEPVVLSAEMTTDAARQVVRGLPRREVDAVFLEFPFPPQIDGDALMAVVPETLDVDVMTTGRIRRYLEDSEGPPPLTVEAALALLDGYDVDITGLDGVVVGEPSPFTAMFREALARRGARMRPLMAPDAAAGGIGDAGLVVAVAARPRLMRAGDLPAGAVVIDAGYFNPGGRGDIDTSGGVDHLSALAPVPGGIGPMTVSVLVERVIAFAEG